MTNLTNITDLETKVWRAKNKMKSYMAFLDSLGGWLLNRDYTILGGMIRTMIPASQE